ncbi:MAG TPA: fructose-bisphosphatase class II [Candidatus Polarisedimenticolia bacterium]|nr:fructose-bisphosphatase class II [Candidatus Polarisedimenticolia bacterium]
MTLPAARGRRTGAQTIVPPDRLPSRNIYSRRARLFSADETASWNERNAALLRLYGLRVAHVAVLPLEPPLPGRGRRGALQTEHKDRLLLTAMMGALAVSLSGRGDLLAVPPAARDKVKRELKETNDRNSTAAMSEALHALCDASPGTRLSIAIGEGARKKPGEKGGNPTLYSGQVIGGGGPVGHAEAVTAGGARQGAYQLAVDTVEGTTKSTLFDSSCGTLLFATEAPIAVVPDMYFDKCQLRGVDGVTVADPLERIVEAVRQARGTREINLFSLDRSRHPIERLVDLGACMRTDTDGDAYPVIAAGLAWGVYPDNLRPLDGVAGDIGGAAETIASAAGASFLGVRSTARFCTGKVKRWEERYDLDDQEREEIRSRGLEPDRVYSIDDLAPGVAGADGAFLAAAITDNSHIPGLDAVYVGGNFASVSALFVGSAGTAELYDVAFAFEKPYDQTVETMTPVLTRLLLLPPDGIPDAVRKALADPRLARRLLHEVATSYYTHLQEERGPGGAAMRLDMESAERAESEASLAVLRALLEQSPGWFL